MILSASSHALHGVVATTDDVSGGRGRWALEEVAVVAVPLSDHYSPYLAISSPPRRRRCMLVSAIVLEQSRA